MYLHTFKGTLTYPEQLGESYILLKEVLEKTGLATIGKVTVSTKERSFSSITTRMPSWRDHHAV